jgi:quercetin dioxygenase-like cupin family protein
MIKRTLIFTLLLCSVVRATAQPSPESVTVADPPLSINLSEVKWEKIMPDLGDNSPEISILHVNPTTHATQLLVRVPKNFHVPKHWHTANETHTILTGSCIFECDGKRGELAVGGFNMPAKMVHEAWTTDSGCLFFITVDGEWDVNWVNGAPTAEEVRGTVPK